MTIKLPNSTVAILICGLMFTSGFALGQRQAASKFAKYFAAPANMFSMRLLQSQTELMREFFPFSNGVGIPSLYFDDGRRKFIADALVSSELTTANVGKAKGLLETSVVFTIGTIKASFPELADNDVEVRFSTLDQQGRHLFADYTEGKLSFH